MTSSSTALHIQKPGDLFVPTTQSSCNSEKIAIGGFMYRLADIMSEERVESFFRDYFATWSDAETSLMLMHAYIAIAQADASRRPLTDKTRLSSVEIVAILKKMVSDSHCRHMMVEAMQQYTGKSNRKFVEAFDHVYKKNNAAQIET